MIINDVVEVRVGSGAAPWICRAGRHITMLVDRKNLTLGSLVDLAGEQGAPVVWLSDRVQEQILTLLGNRCRQGTKQRLAEQLNQPLNNWPGKGWQRRVYIDEVPGTVSYCAGQDYGSDIARTRQELLRQ
ncbi:hypothetical protein D3C85_646060 [compost metagenome]